MFAIVLHERTTAIRYLFQIEVETRRKTFVLNLKRCVFPLEKTVLSGLRWGKILLQTFILTIRVKIRKILITSNRNQRYCNCQKLNSLYYARVKMVIKRMSSINSSLSCKGNRLNF